MLISACGPDTTAPTSSDASDLSPDHFSIVTAESEIVLRSGRAVLTGEIPFQFTNLSERSVSLPNCNRTYPVVLEKWNESDWVQAWSGVMMGCVSPPILVGAGEVFADTLKIFAGQDGTQYYPQFTSDPIDGTYRLALARAYWDYDEEDDRGALLPERLRISNEFTIRVE
jgi:hypothetical protein